jgi:mycothiol synthase
MTLLTPRSYAGDADRERIRDFLVAATAASAPPYRYWHVGDLLWGMYQNTVFDPYASIHLWEDERGELVAVVWSEEPGDCEIQVAPALRNRSEVEEAMLRWAEERARAGGSPTLTVRAFAGDTVSVNLLARHGFVRDERTPAALIKKWGYAPDGYGYAHMARDLRQPIPEPDPPPGWIVRAVGDEQEWEERVNLHRDVWAPSRVTLDAYRRLRAVPGYTPELDLVAIAPDGTLASYCICWLDSTNAVGEFEPVGTRAAYRGQHAGRAVMLEGLRRLRDHGCATALVLTGTVNTPALRLYKSVGFRIFDVSHSYVKVLRV